MSCVSVRAKTSLGVVKPRADQQVIHGKATQKTRVSSHAVKVQGLHA